MLYFVNHGNYREQTQNLHFSSLSAKQEKFNHTWWHFLLHHCLFNSILSCLHFLHNNCYILINFSFTYSSPFSYSLPCIWTSGPCDTRARNQPDGGLWPMEAVGRWEGLLWLLSPCRHHPLEWQREAGSGQPHQGQRLALMASPYFVSTLEETILVKCG